MKLKKLLTMVAAGLVTASAGFAANSLSVTNGAAMEGTKGLAVNCDSSANNVYVESQDPALESHYKAIFLIRPAALKLNAGTSIRIGRFVTVPGGDSVLILLRRTDANNWAIKVKYRDEASGSTFKNLDNLSLVINGNHNTTKKVMVEWQADTSNGAGNGFVKVARCGNATSDCNDPEAERSSANIDNETYRVDTARFGLLYDTGDLCAGAGAYHFDGFESYR